MVLRVVDKFAIGFFDIGDEIIDAVKFGVAFNDFTSRFATRMTMKKEVGSGAYVVRFTTENGVRGSFRMFPFSRSNRSRHYAAPFFNGTTSAVSISPAAAAILFSISFKARRSAVSPMWAYRYVVDVEA